MRRNLRDKRTIAEPQRRDGQIQLHKKLSLNYTKSVIKSKLQMVNNKNICIIYDRPQVNMYVKNIYKSIIKIVNALRKKSGARNLLKRYKKQIKLIQKISLIINLSKGHFFSLSCW